MTGTVYAVASGKGGVGKTTTAINLGAMLAAANYEVVVVDTDLGMANVEGYLDFELAGPTLHEVLAGEADVADAIYEAPGDIDVLPSSTDIHAFAQSQTANLQRVVAELRDSYEYVLLDTGAGISYDTILPLSLADGVLLVTTPDVAAVRDTSKTGELAARVEATVRGAVLTQRSNDILNADDVEGTLDTDVLTVVPDDEAVPMGIDAGRPLAAFAPNSPAAKAYRELADILTGATDTPELSGEPRPADSRAPTRADAEAELPDDDPATAASKATFDADPVHDLIDERIVEDADRREAAESTAENASESSDDDPSETPPAESDAAESDATNPDAGDSDDFDTALAERAAEFDEPMGEDGPTRQVVPTASDEPTNGADSMEDADSSTADEPTGDSDPIAEAEPAGAGEADREAGPPEESPDLPDEIVDAESDDVDDVPFQDDPVPAELNAASEDEDEDDGKDGLFGRIGSLFR
ncbi:cell division ATPase MinD [Haladaptatus salinisoli]|uniref:cell division ATPase MinD n=1 Tax=Haladaptatus salinisoli TaxID=2884876 RepID=UPI001D0BB13F|nr:cell division ATPase MinD [Haladaptatus salinisoli]